MQTRFEQFAVTNMLGSRDSPPRLNGRLCFDQTWERQAFGIAIALSVVMLATGAASKPGPAPEGGIRPDLPRQPQSDPDDTRVLVLH